jgi:dUTP pyrophosphatase
MDLVAALPPGDVILLEPFSRALVGTGIAIELPPGYEAQIRPRSGMAIECGITVLNSPGTIDADYRGEIGVILVNLGSESFVLMRGMRIAQMVISKYEKIQWNIVDQLTSSDRGAAGFGSSGQ